MTTRKDFIEALERGPMLFDGATGTMFYDRGVFHTRNYDELNVSQPDLVRGVHRAYVEAGADIIESNTFGANRVSLGRFNLAEQTEEIIRAGVQLAQEAALETNFVAGAIGPTGIHFTLATAAEREESMAALGEQMEILADAGADLIVLETFTSLMELEAVVMEARRRAPNLPVVAQQVFGTDGLVQGALTPLDVARRLGDAGAHVVGANCVQGPPKLFDVGSKMVESGLPVSIQPNAGLPANVDGRTIYVANPENFGVYARRMLKAGVKLIGGCCGTTPDHTRAMLGAVRMMATPAVAARPRRKVPTHMPLRPDPVVPIAERSRLGARLARGEFVASVELTSPPGVNPDKTLRRIRKLTDGGADIINIADGPRATARMGNLAFCSVAQMQTGVEAILHVCSRDRNYLGLVAHLLGAHALGIRNLVVITGDPPKMGDYPFATPVYDVDSIGLLSIAAGLNAGVDPAGKEIGGHTSFLLATGAEPAAADYDRELRRLEEKHDAGAELVMTQPVYEPKILDRFLEDVEPMGLPVMVGLLPLASHRNAEFLHNEVPGMQVPDDIRKRMAAVDSGPEARAEGVAIASEALAAVADRVAGAYIMPPFNRVESALAILETVRGRWKPAGREEKGE